MVNGQFPYVFSDLQSENGYYQDFKSFATKDIVISVG